MRNFAVLLAMVILPALVYSQGGHSRRRTPPQDTAGPYNEPPVTFYGKIKTITKKEITINLDSGEQTLTMRRSGKTRFSRNGQEIKPADIAEGTRVAVDAIMEPDQKVAALNVTVAPAGKTAQP